MFSQKIDKAKIKTWFVTEASSGIGQELRKKIAINKKDKRYKQFDDCDYIIVNFWNTVNYGASITAWAMQELIKDFGFSCMLLNHNDFWNIDLYNNSFSKRFADKFLNISKIYSNNELTGLSKNAKGVILGSDQVLRLDYMGHNLYKYLLNWVEPNIQKIALSASFGIDKVQFIQSKKFTPSVNKYMKKALQSFDFLSCREISGREIYKDIFGLASEVILDPVFLIKKEKYDDIISYSTVDNANKIVSYVLDDNEEYNRLYNYLTQKENTECITINNTDYDVEDWLKSIKECKYFITDSFHGVCFALIFGKPFVCIRNKERGNARFDSLIEMFKISKNFVYSVDEIINEKCNFYHNISDLINDYKKKHLKVIESVLVQKYSNNPYATQNKIQNYKYLKNLFLLLKLKKIKIYFKYLKYKILSKITWGTRRLHYKNKQKYYKNALRNGGNLL